MTYHASRWLSLPAACIAVVACAAGDTAADAGALRQRVDGYLASYVTPDTAAHRSFLAADVVQIPPDAPMVRGADAVVRAYAGFYAAHDLEIETTVDDVVVSGDLAAARVTFRQTWRPKAGGDEGRQAGTWLMVWRRDEAGEWRLAQEIWSPYPPG